MKKRPALMLAVIWCLCFAGCGDGTGGHTGGTPVPVLASIDEVIDYLADPELDGSDPDNPVQLAVAADASEWPQLVDAIARTGKYVALDLSRCSNVPPEFSYIEQDPDTPRAIVSLVLPKGITKIGDSAFYHYRLRHITLPDGLIEIGDSAFTYQGNLTEIALPASLTSIGSFAFSVCRGLTQITLPASLTEIGPFAFSACTGLTRVICRAETPPVLRQDEFDERGQFKNTSPNLTIRVPAASVAAYKAAWNEWADKIGGM